MKKKLYLLALAVTLITLAGAAPVWAAAAGDSPQSANVTVNVNVNKAVGIVVESGSPASITVTASDMIPGNVPISGTAATTQPVVRVDYYSNDTAWTISSQVTGDFSDSSLACGAGGNKLTQTVAAVAGSPFTYSEGLLTTGSTNLYTGVAKTGGGAGNSVTWPKSDITYKFYANGAETYSASAYSATITYTMTGN